MDIYMPQCSGLEAAKIIRQKCELLSVPIVFLSTESDPDKHLAAIELGGDDFLQKPISDDKLLVAVRSRAERFRHLRSRMNRDGLTGLLNHSTIKSELDTEIARCHRLHTPLCYAMIDLDDFKNINDKYGHPFGDRVIKTLARLLISRLRKTDIIGRYGGEEFAVIMPDATLKTAEIVINDIRENFSNITHKYGGDKFNCTLSAGVAQLKANSSRESLIKQADEALYDSKHKGKNTVSIN
jgi:diguanylate cyclase (GGDEF)-like protein